MDRPPQRQPSQRTSHLWNRPWDKPRQISESFGKELAAPGAAWRLPSHMTPNTLPLLRWNWNTLRHRVAFERQLLRAVTRARTRAHTPTHAHTPHTRSLSHTHTRSLSHTRTLSHTATHTNTHKNAHAHTEPEHPRRHCRVKSYACPLQTLKNKCLSLTDTAASSLLYCNGPTLLSASLPCLSSRIRPPWSWTPLEPNAALAAAPDCRTKTERGKGRPPLWGGWGKGTGNRV